MHPAYLIPILGLAILSITNALAINNTQLLSPLQPRKFNPLPNPYHVFNSPIILDFDKRPDASLPNKAVLSLFDRSHRAISRHIQLNGDSPIPLGLQGYRFGNLQLSYISEPQYRIMFYSEVLAVIRGLAHKMQQEGYKERTAIILHDAGGGEMETGEVDVGRVAPSVAQQAVRVS